LIDKELLKKLDKSEDKRVSGILRSWKPHHVSVVEVYRSDEVRKRLASSRPALLTNQYNVDNVCATVPFYDSVVAEVCNSCPCVDKPDSIIPLLEESVLIPVLVSRYETYPKGFISTLFKYPYLSQYELGALRTASVIENEVDSGAVCKHCVAKELRGSESYLRNYSPRKSEFYRHGLESIASPSFPVWGADVLLLTDALSSLASDNEVRFRQVLNMSECVEAFRSATSMRAVLQLPMTLMDEVASLEAKYPTIATNYDEGSHRNAVTEGLSICYDRRIDLTKYLEIVMPRKKEITSIVSAILAKTEKGDRLIEVQREVEEINSRIRKLSQSPSTMVSNYVTNLFTGNTGIIAKCIMGAAIGYALGGPFTGLGVGVGAGVGTRLSSDAHLPPVHFRIDKRLIEALEPGYQKMLAYILRQNLSDIQIWQLQRKLKKAQSTQ